MHVDPRSNQRYLVEHNTKGDVTGMSSTLFGDVFDGPNRICTEREEMEAWRRDRATGRETGPRMIVVELAWIRVVLSGLEKVEHVSSNQQRAITEHQSWTAQSVIFTTTHRTPPHMQAHVSPQGDVSCLER